LGTGPPVDGLLIDGIDWDGETKDLSFIPGVGTKDVLLVDDFKKYIHPGQEKQWI